MPSILKKDFNKKWYIIIIVFLCLIRIVLTFNQMVYVTPVDAGLDDMLMFRLAKNLVSGQWLGEYNYLTLSKHMFFAFWLAFLNILNIPYLIAGHILYVISCLFTVNALKPVLKTYWSKIILFGVLAYNTISWSEYTLRVYRDNIFPSLCLLCIIGMVGFCLRIHEPIKKSLFYIIIASISFTCAYLTREDGIWLLPFMICAIIVYVFCLIFKSSTIKSKLISVFLTIIPFITLSITLLFFCAMNYNYYGRFIFSDFTSKDFTSAVGAFSRADTTGAHPKIFVPYEVRQDIYSKVPLANEIGTYLETNAIYSAYGNAEKKEIYSGGFYWALRKVAFENGFATNATQAEIFYTKLANDINKACESGLINTTNSVINSTQMPFNAEYIPLTINEIFNSFKQLFSLFLFDEQQHQIKPYSSILCIFNEYAESQEDVEIFLHTKTAHAAQANTDLVYLDPLQNIFAKCLNIITWIMRIIIVLFTFISLIWLLKQIALIFKHIKNKKFDFNFLYAIIYIGLLFNFILRVAMISYIEAISFQIGTYSMYLSSAMPFLLIVITLGTIHFITQKLNIEKEK